MMMNEDLSYLISAEFYDLMSEQHWLRRQEDFVRILQTHKPYAKRVVDVGCGSGKSLPLLQKLYPEVHIHAVEPSGAMRIALMTRVLGEAALRHCVSIYPSTFEYLKIDQPVDIILLSGCVGFFTPQERVRFWAKASSLLAPEGIIVVDTMAISSPLCVAQQQVANTRLGTQRYEISMSGAPVDGTDLMRWRMQFDQYEGEDLIRSHTVLRDWHTFGLDRVISEAAEADLYAAAQENNSVPTLVLKRGSASH
ncbi:class I SAM-dependent methyltransferase [Buttiauxella warmboldiae]|uniref:Class I SAM-dependent methyltransferase n=1 Tax=Buttiauxella warmboldiae TaxID=82993 RepID=A0A3N5E3Z1_9ENTR|nr:class I SAM-dependent methyltransferase [Buttiauxella warmboldiae]RPH24132.1 class I SAM-dependent methyltransferase [Buttiauxella warmboldiae]